MEGRKDGRTEGRKDGRTEGRKDGRTEGRKDGRTEGRKDGRTAGRQDGKAAGREGGREEGRKGDRTYSQTGFMRSRVQWVGHTTSQRLGNAATAGGGTRIEVLGSGRSKPLRMHVALDLRNQEGEGAGPFRNE